MTNGVFIVITLFSLLLCVFFFFYGSVKNKENKENKERIKKAYEQTAKYNEVKKENEKKINDMESTSGADSVNNAFDLLHDVSKKGQKRNGK